MNQHAAPDPATLLCKRILIVEDDDALYQALRDSLDTVPASRLDAALVDMDPLGSDRAASLAQQLGDRNVPIVWITDRREREATAVATREYLRKPFTERQLLDSIAAAVGELFSGASAEEIER